MIQKGSLRFGVYLASSAIKSHGDDLIKPRVYLTAMKNKNGLEQSWICSWYTAEYVAEMTQLCPLSVDVFYTKLKLLKLSAITIWLSKIPNCGKLNVNLHRGGETALCNE